MFNAKSLALLLVPAALVAQELPKAEKLWERHIQVTGGKSAYATKKVMVQKGTVQMMGMQGSLLIYKAAPQFSRSEMTFPNLGKILEGFDGKVAWGYNPMQGPQIKTGAEKDFYERDAKFDMADWKEQFAKLETLGQENVDGQACYKVLATPQSGPAITIYFDIKTGLQTKMAFKMPSAMGEIAAEIFVKDYRKAGDILMPHTIINQIAGQKMTITFSNMEWNGSIPQDARELPQDVKALIAPKPAPAPATTAKI